MKRRTENDSGVWAAIAWWHKALVGVVFIASLSLGVNSYFAKAADLKRVEQDITQGRLELQLLLLEQELTKYQAIPETERRPLTRPERERKETIERQLERLQKMRDQQGGR